MIGKTLGHYEILAPLGAGGMGEVYRALDATLKREVAIKVLPQELSADVDRLARLEREAHLLASLNHPNIATIFSLEEIDETRFLVLELIDGESLQQRLERGPLPIADALDICGQVARALEVAHEAGIVHRDLKPANVLITHDDRAKVLDFGIAKTLRPAGEADPTAHATALTMAGTLVGTVPYMSPEQVRGEAVDKRSDVWAFGCLFFETLSGEGPFTRETVADTLAAIVGEEPHWESLPAEVSPAVRMLLHRCLQKSPKVRQRDIGDAWVEINQSLSHPGGVPMSLPPTIAAADAPGLGRRVAAGLVVGALAIGALAGWWAVPEAPAPGEAMYFEVDFPEGGDIPEGSGPAIAISPDGKKIAVVLEVGSSRRLFVRRLDRLGALEPVAETEGAKYPFFSPDGGTLAFDTPEKTIEAISLDGANSDTLCRECQHGAWGDDNSIIVETDSGWQRIAAPGDVEMEPLPAPTLDGVTLRPERMDVLPGSRAVLFEAGSAIYAFSLDSEKVFEVAKDASDPYYAGGYVLFPRDNTLYAVPFDVDTLLPTAEPFVAQHRVSTEPAGALHAAAARGVGSLAFLPARTAGFSVGWVDRTGEWDEMAAHIGDVGIYPRVSPDGTKVALGLAGDRAPGVYVVDDTTKVLDRFLAIDRVEIFSLSHLVWSRDGSSVTVSVERRAVDGDGHEGAIVRKVGSGPVETLRYAPWATARDWAPASWTPGDRGLIYGVEGEAPRLLVIGADAAEGDARIFDDDADTRWHALSNDGKWLSYVVRQDGFDVVYARPFSGGNEIRVSLEGGTEPRWARDDSELFYVTGDRLMSAKLRVADGELSVESVEDLLDLKEYPGRSGYGRYDVHPDGNRFAVIRPNEVDDLPHVNVVVNWFEEIARLASEGR